MSTLAVIPQQSSLFQGTVRWNLDPLCRMSDAAMWHALERVQLAARVRALPLQLDECISEGGEQSFSEGQRALIGMARAMLSPAHIVIMDEGQTTDLCRNDSAYAFSVNTEAVISRVYMCVYVCLYPATASVDSWTDSVLQSNLRSDFAGRTVLCIAHRLHTIADFDRVLVMDHGRMLEFDSPYILLQTPQSAFASMVQQTGETNAQALRHIVSQAWQSRQAQL